jgi:hypothetical protein
MRAQFKKVTAVSLRNKRKYGRIRKYKKVAKPIGKGATNTLIRRALNRSVETKYVAENVESVPVVVPDGATTVAGASCRRMMPFLTQGSDDYQRNGNKIQPIRCKSQWNINISNPFSPLLDVTVHLAVFRVRGAGTDTAVASIPGGDFLTVGDGTNIDPRGPGGAPPISSINMLNFLNNYKVNRERYTLMKWFKINFKKGPNDANGAVGAGTNNNPPTVLGAKLHRRITLSWKPPQLRYDNAAATLPTNHFPVYMIWATPNDGTNLPNGALGYTCRTEMFFKDA